ncbi:MAG TPA: glycosyltransferase family 2 protein [Candidatus Aminicenantes bacterium]|nr:glycosyltransferase family 2 protein [Candidatus Aminicenantes bacterium]
MAPSTGSDIPAAPVPVLLSVILVAYDRFDLLEEALASLHAHPPSFSWEAIVVDNASREDAAAFIAPRFPGVVVLRNEANEGFGRANNRGAARARGKYLLFLNSDAEALPGTLATMVARMEGEPDIGILGPLTLNPDGSFQLSYGRPISLAGEWYQKVVAPRWETRRFGHPPARSLRFEPGWVSGSCLLTRRELFPGGAVFDPRMFLYFEDHELCLRVRALGHRVVFDSTAAVIHHGGGSMASMHDRVTLEYRRSQLLLYRLRGGWGQLFALRLYLTARFGLDWLTCGFTRARTPRRRLCLQLLRLAWSEIPC